MSRNEKTSRGIITDTDSILLAIIIAATLIIVLNDFYMLFQGRVTHTRFIDFFGGMVALACGALLYTRKRLLAGEMNRQVRESEVLHRTNTELEAKVIERTDLLQSTNTLLETIVQESPLAFVVLDLDWNVRVWSPAAERMFGWTSGEVLGSHVPFIEPERHGEWVDTLKCRLHEGDNMFNDVQRPRKDGTSIEVSGWTSPLHGPSGAVFASLLMYADNRERKAAEEALRKSEERLALFMDNVPGVAFIKETNGGYLQLNRGCRQYYSRLKVDTAVGKTDEELWPAKTAEAFLANDQEVIRTMKAVQVIETADCGDGDLSHFLMNKFPIEDHNGKMLLCAVGIDITEQKKAEKALADLQSRQEAILDNIPDLAWLKHLDGRYITVNNAWEKATGIRQAYAEGKTDRELWSDEQAMLFAVGDQQVVADNAQGAFEEYVQIRSGEWRWFETLKKPLHNDDGDIIGTTGIARDITERKRVEETLREFQEQLSALAAELSLAEERERRRISSELHDQIGQSLALGKIKFNALAAAIGGEAHAPLIAELGEALDECISEVRSLTSQISPPVLHELGFEPALDWLCEWIRDAYGIQAELCWKGPPVNFPEEARGALFQMVRELLINCCKHAGTGVATITCRSFSDRLVVTVADQGAGFDVTALDSRVHSGFGLFSIRQRIRYMGGECRIESAPGSGTTVTLQVPLSTVCAADGV